MTRYMLALSLAILGLCQARTLAYCPTGIADEVFCDDFDTYCTDPDGGYPGHTPQCGTSATPDDAKLRDVWLKTSNYEGGTGCGDSAITVDNTQVLNTPGFYNPSSLPFAGRWPGRNTEYLVQTTFRDWVLSTPGNDVLDLHGLIQAKYGSQYDALIGSDAQPVVLSFMLDTDVPGKILFSDGYMELAYGPPTRQNRSNTDFVWSPNCQPYCDPNPIKQGPFPIMCAQGNPAAGDGGVLPEDCPESPTTTAPIHNAIAVGILAMVKTDPCNCGGAHGGYCDHPVYFDGQVWWKLVSNNPRPSSGTVTPLDGAPAEIPSDIHQPGDFLLWHDPTVSGSQPPVVGGPQNWFKLTVKSGTVKIELTAIETSKLVPGARYQVTSVMDGIPRKYTGPFNTLRAAVSPGCELASNASWDTCAGTTTRTCIPPNLDWPPLPPYTSRTISRGNNARWVDFDDVMLAGPPYSLRGACCLADGGCVDGRLANECPQGSVFRGENTSCVNDAEVCKGACCNKEIGCSDTDITECAFDWQGYDTSCATTGCPCSSLFADADDDGDVDQADFAVFQDCFGGPGAAVGSVCKCFDRDPVPYPGTGADNDVDEYDLDKFELCASGPGIPYDPGCD